MPLYLDLFHGRRDPTEHLDDWGKQGPVFGPLDYVHTTYGSHVKMRFTNLPETEAEVDLHTVDDLLFYDGCYYGDWTVYDIPPADPARLQPFDPAKASPDTLAPEPPATVAPDEVSDEECEACEGLGFLLMQPSDTHPVRIERCDTCEEYASDADAVQACFDLAASTFKPGL